MREVFPFNTSPGTLKPFPCTKNTALKVSTKLQNSTLYGIDYLLPKAFFSETPQSYVLFVASNISMKLSPERNHLPKAQMEVPC